MPSTPRDYSVLDDLTDGVQIIDREWRYVYLNDVTVGQSGYAREALIGHTMMEKYPGIEQSELFGILKSCMEDRQALRTTNDFTFPDGTRKFFQLRIEPISEGIIIFSVDTTEENTHRLLIEDVAAELEVLVERRTDELIARNRELEQLTYAASHDLRSPLRSLRSFSALVRRRSADALDERTLEYLDQMDASAVRMQALVDGLLTHGSLGREQAVEPVDLNAVVQAVRADLAADIEASGAVIEVEALPTVDGMPVEIRVLFQNLIGNAIKYRKPDAPPRIRISAKPSDGGWQFEVADTGIGIEPRFHDRVFDMFQRLHTADEIEGAGIGLAHAEKIVGLHRGRIWVESELGVGSRFYFTIRTGERTPLPVPPRRAPD
jgi:PAS domain S-box-containing protein